MDDIIQYLKLFIKFILRNIKLNLAIIKIIVLLMLLSTTESDRISLTQISIVLISIITVSFSHFQKCYFDTSGDFIFTFLEMSLMIFPFSSYPSKTDWIGKDQYHYNQYSYYQYYYIVILTTLELSK